MVIQKAVKLAMEVFEQKMEDFAGKAAKFMPQGNHKTVSHDGHKYMCLNSVLKLMTHWTHGQTTF